MRISHFSKMPAQPIDGYEADPIMAGPHMQLRQEQGTPNAVGSTDGDNSALRYSRGYYLHVSAVRQASAGVPIDQMKAVEVAAWLHLARPSRAKVRNVYSVLFTHACPNTQNISQVCPNASLVLLEGVTYFAPIQRPEQFNTVVPSFLRGL
ncbi:hypothetical protein FTW19_08200 [Terriglobus albidus]|uniref:Uncharacterized protein n=1 Tax=Terriglobus albidus TaxID=1592106 RepID=A0A5B9E7D3_9BACT|nr:hypothetical protein [Terriglobus albidus]QEE27978.1 hypothetical protein FTW19_08200 [Terriglobus albidus]